MALDINSQEDKYKIFDHYMLHNKQLQMEQTNMKSATFQLICLSHLITLQSCLLFEHYVQEDLTSNNLIPTGSDPNSLTALYVLN